MGTDKTPTWAGVWPDALAFGLGLGVAWSAGWNTTDLVWSLWLSSLVVGYSMIVWTIFGPGVLVVRGAWRDRALVAQVSSPAKLAGGAAVLLAGGLFMLAFFTVHFGMFHFVHSQVLISFFPLDGGPASPRAMAGMTTYLEVLRRYWIFLPVAFIAERAGFRLSPAPAPAGGRIIPPDSVKAADITERLAQQKAAGAGLMTPYKNVVRMHLLIFFFAFAHFARLESFAVYAVVYAVYFFPWRVLKRL